MRTSSARRTLPRHAMSTATEAPVRPQATEPPPQPPASEETARGLGLRTRFFLGAAGLLALTVGLAIAVGSDRASRIAEQKIRADLQAVPVIFEGYRDSQAGARERQVRAPDGEGGNQAREGRQGGAPRALAPPAGGVGIGRGAARRRVLFTS